MSAAASPSCMRATSSKNGTRTIFSARRRIPTPTAWLPRCRGLAAAPRMAAAGCRKSRAWCRRSPAIPTAAASIHAARRSPTSAAASTLRRSCSTPAAWSGVTTMTDAAAMADDVILRVEDLAVHFRLGGGLFGGGARILRAVDGVDLELKRGQCLGLVGESGCGKSTVALSIVGLQAPTRGRIMVEGQAVTSHTSIDHKAFARIAQIVFQDPYASLNPRQTVRRTLEDPLRLHGVTARSEIDDRVASMLA